MQVSFIAWAKKDTDISFSWNTLYRVFQEPERFCFTLKNTWKPNCKCVWCLCRWMLPGYGLFLLGVEGSWILNTKNLGNAEKALLILPQFYYLLNNVWHQYLTWNKLTCQDEVVSLRKAAKGSYGLCISVVYEVKSELGVQTFLLYWAMLFLKGLGVKSAKWVI